MGWWSTDILGGDRPLDYLYELGQKIGVEDLYTEKNIPGVKEKLEGLITSINNGTLFDEEEYEYYIGYQVLAIKLLEYGVKIPVKTKNALIHYINEDVWAQEDEERKETIDNFVRSKGLFEVIGIKLGGKDGK